MAADVTCYDATRHDVSRPVPLGRPIANTQAYLLDAHQQPVPIGVPGEIYIGGDGLAAGYLGRDELTQERFVHHAVLDTDPQRLYRTGDIGRYLPDGNIEFLGRRDHQVKVRGVRIELGEIEVALSKHPRLVQSVAAVWQDAAQPDDGRIVAYLEVSPGERLSVSAWRDFLSSILPDAMMPSAFIELDALPLAPNGKMDRTALPEPDWERPDLATDYAAPRSATEHQISEIWQGLLNVGSLGVHDNFFQLGGHSLLAVQAVNRMRDAMQIELLVTRIFECPTVVSLAQQVDAIQVLRPTPEQISDEREVEVVEI